MHTCIHTYRYLGMHVYIYYPLYYTNHLQKPKIKLGPTDPLLPSCECSPNCVNHSVCDTQCTFCRQHLLGYFWKCHSDHRPAVQVYYFFKPPSVKGEAGYFVLMIPRGILLFVYFAKEKSKDLQVEQTSKTTCNYTLNELFVPGWSPRTDQARIPFENSLFRNGVAGTGGNKLTEIW